MNKLHVAGWVGLLVTVIGFAFGAQTGYAMNPARDFGPRLVWATFAGIYGQEVTAFNGGYWLIPIIAPMLGGPLGALMFTVTYKDHPKVEARKLPDEVYA